MERIKRNERIAVMIKMFLDSPNTLFTLSSFSSLFGIAKTTISEDILLMREIFTKYDLGKLEANMGANGGIKFIPMISKESAYEIIKDICNVLSKNDRKLDGGYVFISDIMSNPHYVNKMADIFVTNFYKTQPDFIVTMASKGIPLAMAVATKLSKQLVVISREKKVTDGTCVSIHYFPHGKTEGRQMMVSKKMIKPGQRALVLDDFMRNGGTIKGICEMMKEFSATVAGIGVAIATRQPTRKVVEDYKALMVVDNVQFTNDIALEPSDWIKSL